VPLLLHGHDDLPGDGLVATTTDGCEEAGVARQAIGLALLLHEGRCSQGLPAAGATPVLLMPCLVLGLHHFVMYWLFASVALGHVQSSIVLHAVWLSILGVEGTPGYWLLAMGASKVVWMPVFV